MALTRTGQFPIGFRRTRGEWQKDLSVLARFATDAGFEVIDLPRFDDEAPDVLADAGLRIGTVDLTQWAKMLSDDAATRDEAIRANTELIQRAAGHGVRSFFTVLIPDDPSGDRKVHLDAAVDSYRQLCEAVADLDVHIVIEGWPGPAPWLGNLACTPADYRAVLSRVDHDVLGVNYDPSHLIRMGIDPVRFAEEFAPRIHHVHAKDTEIIDDALYEHGHQQPATLEPAHGYGGYYWRYTIPGHGEAPWSRLLAILHAAGYQGPICVELEDENFTGSEEKVKRGLTASLEFLRHV